MCVRSVILVYSRAGEVAIKRSKGGSCELLEMRREVSLLHRTSYTLHPAALHAARSEPLTSYISYLTSYFLSWLLLEMQREVGL